MCKDSSIHRHECQVEFTFSVPGKTKKEFLAIRPNFNHIVTLVTAIIICHTFYVNKFDYYRNTLWEVLLSSSIL